MRSFTRPQLPVGILLCSAFFGVLTGSANAAEYYYVRAGASGLGTSWTDALNALPSSLERGSTYFVADGTYTGYTFDDPTSGTEVITVKKATLLNHGSDLGWSSAFGDGVATFNGTIMFKTSYYRFDGVVGGGPGSWKSGHGFKIVQTSAVPAISSGSSGSPAGSHIVISHVEVVGNDGTNQGGGSIANDGIAVYGGADIVVSYAYLHEMGRCIMFLSTTDFVLEYSYTGDFTSTSGTHAELASIWNFAVPVKRLTFRYNVFTHAEGTGGLIIEGDDVKIYGNIFYQPTGDPWYQGNGLIGTWTVSTLTNTKVHNNTFVNIGNNGPVLGSLFTAPITGNEARNNLFYNVASTGLGELFKVFSNNHYIGTTAPATESGKTSGSGDPFVAFASLDFRLKVASPSGMPLAAPYNVDMFGNVRGEDGTWEKGAVEFAGGGATPPANFRLESGL